MPASHIAGLNGKDAFSRQLLAALQHDQPQSCALLVNASRHATPEATMAHSTAFMQAADPGTDTLIVTILHQPPPGPLQLTRKCQAAALWAFTQGAALAWAPRGIRVNAIGLATSPAGPFEPQEQAGRAAGDAPASPASMADVARTLGLMVACPSITGQIVRLGW